jgi:hypothetical protein
MGRPLSPLELEEMAERLPSKPAVKARRKAAVRKPPAKRASGRRTKRAK